MSSSGQNEKHEVFGILDQYSAFYGDLAGSVIGQWMPGASPICGTDTYVFSAIQGTLESIRQILAAGRISDAYALLRKYHDSAIINIYSNLYLEDHFSIENFVVKKIDDWIRGKEKLPDFKTMANYIRASKKLAPISALLFGNGDQTYWELRERCNDHTHYNFFSTMQLNDPRVFMKERPAVLEEFSKDLSCIFILHIAYLFRLSPQCIRYR